MRERKVSLTNYFPNFLGAKIKPMFVPLRHDDSLHRSFNSLKFINSSSLGDQIITCSNKCAQNVINFRGTWTNQKEKKQLQGFVLFVMAMVMAGRSDHLTTFFPGQA